MLRGLAYAEYYNLIPFVNWPEGNPYYDSSVKWTNNAFEYYFEPVSEVLLDDVERGKRVILSRDYVDCPDAFADDSYSNAESTINLYALYNKKYIVIREEARSKIYEDINKLIGGKRTLAVHIRGVEWGNIAGHPEAPNLKEYFDQIDRAKEEHQFEQIFLATDSE